MKQDTKQNSTHNSKNNSKHIFRKKVLAAILAVTLLATMTGCASGDGASTTGANTASLKIAVNAEPDNLNPMLSAASDTQGIMMNIYEGLLAFDAEGNFIPALAESYTISEDELTYSFTLKQGIKFHDGKDFSAKDVKYTYEKLAGLNGEEPLSKTLADVLEAVETPDDYTVNFKLKHIDAGFLCRCIISIQEEGYEDDSTKPIGTGPFKFTEYVQGQKLVMEKNPEYHTIEDRIPEIEKVEFRIMTDSNAILMALKSGDLDIAQVDPANLEVLGDKFSITESHQNMVQLMALNNTVAPLDNEKVRQAINYAIDKQEIIDTVMKGHGIKLQSFLSPAMAYYYNENIKGYEQDLEKSKALLAEAGYEDGFTMTITVPSNYQTHVNTAQIIKSQLEKVGIVAEIQLVEWAQWLDQVYTKADYEASIVGHSGKLDPQDFLNRFTSTYGKNYFKYSNPEYDAKIEAAASTTDQAERAAIYKECQQMLADQAVAVYIQDPHLIYAVNKKYTNMKLYPVTFYDMGSIRFAE